MSIPDSIISSIGSKIPVVVGPTAVGKTGFSIQLAKQLNGEIISVDSRQIYRDFIIGTAQPTNEELKSVPHNLIGTLNADEIVNSGQYADWVSALIVAIKDRGHLPVLVGGSFLYLQSIINGIIRTADGNPEIRQNILQEIDEKGIDAVMSRLHQIDSDYAAIVHPNDVKRLVRALEIYEITGKPPSEVFLEQQKLDQELQNQYFVIGLTCERAKLYQRIENRVDDMIQAGWQLETHNLLASGVSRTSHAMQSLGYKQLVEVEQGSVSLEEAIVIIKQKTRQFAKKQITWMNKMSIDMILDCDVSYKSSSLYDWKTD